MTCVQGGRGQDDPSLPAEEAAGPLHSLHGGPWEASDLLCFLYLLALGTTSSSTTKSLLETQKLRPHPDPENHNQHFEQDHQMTCLHIKEQLSTRVFNAV